jgi:phage shock protein A
MMSYFSRLTDIVTCNLSELLAQEADPMQALQRIIAEMEEGLGGAQRSVTAARSSMKRIAEEMTDHRSRAESCLRKARESLSAGDEAQARLSLLRKQEIEDVVAGLEQQLKAAKATAEHLATTQRALDARLSEARRKLERLQNGAAVSDPDDLPEAAATPAVLESLDAQRARRIDEELEALRQQLG